MGEKPSRVEILVHVRELPLDALELGYRPAECSALLHVFRSGVKGRLRYPHSLGCYTDSPGIQSLHGYGESPILLAQKTVRRNACILQYHTGRGLTAYAQLVLFPVNRGPVQISIYDKGGDALGFRTIRICSGKNRESTGVTSVANKLLGTVQNVEVPILPRCRRYCRGVRARSRLGRRGSSDDSPEGCGLLHSERYQAVC